MSSLAAWSFNTGKLWDANAYRQGGGFPWTFFAFPTSLADEHGLPPDEDVKQLLSELLRRRIQVGIWVNGIAENTTYFACPKSDIQRLNEAVAQLEACGFLEDGFLVKRTEHLFSLLAEDT